MKSFKGRSRVTEDCLSSIALNLLTHIEYSKLNAGWDDYGQLNCTGRFEAAKIEGWIRNIDITKLTMEQLQALNFKPLDINDLLTIWLIPVFIVDALPKDELEVYSAYGGVTKMISRDRFKRMIDIEKPSKSQEFVKKHFDYGILPYIPEEDD